MTIQKLPLQKLVIKQKGEKPIHLLAVFISDSLPYLGIEAIETDEVKQYADWYSTIHSTEKDVFVVADGARNGLILKGKKGAVGSTLFCITPLWIDSDFLYYFLKLKEIQRKDTRHIDVTFWNISVPIVSLTKQKQIAKNINEALSVFEKQNKDAELKLIKSLKSLVNSDLDILENIQSLDDFKRAILNLAVTGTLTNEWRKHKNIKKEWTKVKLNKIATITMGLSPDGNSYNKEKVGTPLINGPSEFGIHPWSILTSKDINQYTTSPKKLCKKGDLLICVRGSTTGKTNISGIEASIGRGLASIRVKDYQPFINILFFSLQKEILNYASSSVSTFPAITFDYLNDIELFLPSLEEQEEIVRFVYTVFEEAENINQDYQTEKLKQKELQKAIISSFYENLLFDENIEDVLSEIEFARKQKEAEIIDLRKKQKQFREKLSTLPKMGIIDVLKSSDTPVFVNDLWGKSKYNGNIDAFYEALKQEHEKKTISWKLNEENNEIEVPQSLVSLNQTTL